MTLGHGRVDSMRSVAPDQFHGISPPRCAIVRHLRRVLTCRCSRARWIARTTTGNPVLLGHLWSRQATEHLCYVASGFVVATASCMRWSFGHDVRVTNRLILSIGAG